MTKQNSLMIEYLDAVSKFGYGSAEVAKAYEQLVASKLKRKKKCQRKK